MTALDDFIADLRENRISDRDQPVVCNIDTFIAALQLVQQQTAANMQIATVRSGSPLASGTLFNYVGGIRIVSLVGIVRQQIQAQPTTIQIFVQNDALAAVPLCLSANANGDTVGTLYHLPNSAGSALQQHVGGADNNSNALDVPIATICTATGKITVTFGAASTGIIDWFLLWEPITADGDVL